MTTYDVEYLFEGGFYWGTVDAETPEKALEKAKNLVQEDDEIVCGASNYDSVGDLQVISVKVPNCAHTPTVEYKTPEHLLREAAADMAEALKLALDFAEAELERRKGSRNKSYIDAALTVRDYARAALGKAGVLHDTNQEPKQEESAMNNFLDM